MNTPILNPEEIMTLFNQTGMLPYETIKHKVLFFMGVDPGGSSGAIAVIGVDIASNEIIGMAHNEFSKRTLKEWYNFIKGWDITHCVVENVHSMPRQGIVSAMKFGQNLGQIEMALTAAEVPFEKVTPQKWVKFYGMKKDKDESQTQWKRRLRERLQQLIPSLKVTNNIADAYLIAYYNLKQYLLTQKDVGDDT